MATRVAGDLAFSLLRQPYRSCIYQYSRKGHGRSYIIIHLSVQPIFRPVAHNISGGGGAGDYQLRRVREGCYDLAIRMRSIVMTALELREAQTAPKLESNSCNGEVPVNASNSQC